MGSQEPGRAIAVTLAALAAAITIAIAGPVHAERGQSSIFTVAKYPVQASANNAVAAKEQALADGRKAAFRSLLKRLVPVTAYPSLKTIEDVQVATMFDGFTVRSESNSTTAYIATLDFSFRPDSVRNMLRRAGIPYVEEQAQPVVLIAALREGGKLVREGGEADNWLGVWRELDLDHTLTPLRVDAVKPVIHNDTLAMLVDGDDSAIRVLANEYGSGDNAVTAIAEIDKPAGRLHVTLAGRDGAGVFNLKRSYRLIDGDVGYAMELAAVVSLGIIEGRWKAIKTRWLASSGGAAENGAAGYDSYAAAAGQSESIHIEAEFSGLGEWTAMRDKLEATPGVSGISVAAMSARGADLALNYPGGGGALSEALIARGLSLTDLGGVWLLRARY